MSQKTITLSRSYDTTDPYVLPLQASNQSLLLVVEEGVQVVVTSPELTHAGEKDPGCAVEFCLKERAVVTWYERTAQAFAAVSTVKVVLAAQASFSEEIGFPTELSGTRQYLFVLAGAYCQVAVRGNLLLHGQAQQKIVVEQLHQGVSSKSDVTLYAVVDDKASLDYSGTITIQETAVHSEAFQTQKNLIVSPSAQVTSVPNLQVLTHQVQCGHGCAVSYVNDDHLFYLQARGISYECARALLIAGFIA